MTSRAQVDKLGERLKAGPTTEADLRLLDEYRLTFAAAYQSVLKQITGLGLRATGRSAKTNKAIVEKLRRESIRLSQIQDIAGCRVVVPAVATQDEEVARICGAVPNPLQIDRRRQPSHGYRAVHVVASPSGMSVEIQIRTAWQHLWAETSEKLADTLDPAIKYGQGPAHVRAQLQRWSVVIADWEAVQASWAGGGQLPFERGAEIARLQDQVYAEAAAAMAIHLSENAGEDDDAVPD